MISFIIPTINNSTTLLHCINSILSILRNGDEIIVVHQGETKNISYHSNHNIKHVHSEKTGLSIARNTGAGLARNDIVAFVDDDVIVDNNYIVNAEAQLSEGVNGLCGRIMITDTHTSYAKSQDDSSGPITKSLSSIKKCLGANMVFRKGTFDEIGGYDPLFGAGAKYGGAEDIDIVLRMLYLRKESVFYASNVKVYHDKENREDKFIYANKAFSYGNGEGALYAKHCFKHSSIIALFHFYLEIMKPLIKILISIIRLDAYNRYVYVAIIKGRIQGFVGYIYGK